MGITASCFAQVLSLVDRGDFADAVERHDAEQAAKGFLCWHQFVSMAFSHLGGANSLREVTGGLATALGKVVHLGLDKAPPRATLAYANAHRPWKVYEDVFYSVLGRTQAVAESKGRRFRFKNPLRSLDSTVIELCVKVFDWARFRRTKGAIKLHLQLDHQGYLPCWALVTDGKTHDVKAAQRLSFPPGTIVAMDRGYNDYALFGAWTDAEVFFVTRAKTNMVYETVEEREVPERGNVLSDETIRLTGARAEEKCPHLLRRIVVWDEANERELVLLTNLFHLAASTVAAVYKERWQIELFFKALKQNLKVKTFLGTSENAVQTQVWIALIAILLLKYLQLRSSWGWSLSNLAAMLRFNLLTYRDLWAWLDAPFAVPIVVPADHQLELFGPRLLDSIRGQPQLCP
jgi:hypothetical protein